jgi:UPF0271 protein
MSGITVDLNADLGEGEPHDAKLLTIVSSCNIACGGHTGDAESMRQAVQLAASHGVSVGAHPSYPDREGFGRQSCFMAGDELLTSLTKQVEALAAVCELQGVSLNTLKAHGALYNDAGGDAKLAEMLVQLAARFQLALIGLPAAATESQARRHGVTYLREGFVDRSYQPDGSLTPRNRDGALITDASAAAEQALRLATGLPVITMEGNELQLQVDTLCLHGDTPSAAVIARAVKLRLDTANVEIVCSTHAR